MYATSLLQQNPRLKLFWGAVDLNSELRKILKLRLTCDEALLGNGGMAPGILNLGTRWKFLFPHMLLTYILLQLHFRHISVGFTG
jgi:hypothetical protein